MENNKRICDRCLNEINDTTFEEACRNLIQTEYYDYCDKNEEKTRKVFENMEYIALDHCCNCCGKTYFITSEKDKELFFKFMEDEFRSVEDSEEIYYYD